MEHLEAAVKTMEIKLSSADIEHLENHMQFIQLLDIVYNSKGIDQQYEYKQ